MYLKHASIAMRLCFLEFVMRLDIFGAAIGKHILVFCLVVSNHQHRFLIISRCWISLWLIRAFRGSTGSKQQLGI